MPIADRHRRRRRCSLCSAPSWCARRVARRTRSRSPTRPSRVTVVEATGSDVPAVAHVRRHARAVGRGEGRPAARLGVRRHGARAAGRRGEEGRGARDARLPQRQRHQPRRSRCRRARSKRSQQALAHEAARVQDCSTAVSCRRTRPSRRTRRARASRPQLLATQAKMLGTSLEVNDCVLRAPVRRRDRDAGDRSRARSCGPGTSIVDHRRPQRPCASSADVPEVDFDVVAPGTQVHDPRPRDEPRISSATIARRAPAADPSTRTVHFEIDVPDPTARIPVGTTGRDRASTSASRRRRPRSRSPRPRCAARRRACSWSRATSRASAACRRLGESGGSLFLDPTLAAGQRTSSREGRALLKDGDRGRRRSSSGRRRRAASATGATAAASRDRRSRSTTRSRS